MLTNVGSGSGGAGVAAAPAAAGGAAAPAAEEKKEEKKEEEKEESDGECQSRDKFMKSLLLIPLHLLIKLFQTTWDSVYSTKRSPSRLYSSAFIHNQLTSCNMAMSALL